MILWPALMLLPLGESIAGNADQFPWEEAECGKLVS